MYRDAKEELSRLEEALLEQSEEVTETVETEEWEENPQTPDTPEEKPVTGLLATVITLACGVLAVLIFWFIRYGRVFL